MQTPLENWRKEIDVLDKQLLELLAKRIAVVTEIGKYKKAHNIPPLDEKRWQEVLASKITQAKLLHLSKDFIINIYTLIHTYALEIEANTK